MSFHSSCLVFSFFFVHLIISNYKIKTTLALSMAIGILGFIMFALCPYASSISPVLLWVLLFLAQGLKSTSMCISSTAVSLCVHNSSEPNMLNTAHGLSFTCAAILCVFSPFLVAQLFKMAITGSMHTFFAFFSVMIIACIGLLLTSLALPKSIDVAKKRKNDEASQ